MSPPPAPLPCPAALPDAGPVAPRDAAAGAAAVAAAVAEARARSGRSRVGRVTIGGREHWVKWQEVLTGRLRLQKGDPARGFARERAAFAALSGCGLPVPELAASGPDFLLVPDMGPSLLKFLRRSGAAPAERLAACRAGGAALAALHRAGFAHGRPNLKDICWAGGRATLIDFERFDPARNGRGRMRGDVLLLAFSACAELGTEAPEFAAMMQGYREDAPAGVWAAAVRLARRTGWMAPPPALLRWIDGRKGELAALRPTLRALARLRPD